MRLGRLLQFAGLASTCLAMDHVINLDQVNEYKIFQVALQGEKIELVAEENRSTGYQWFISTVQENSVKLLEFEYSKEGQDEDSPAIG